MPFSDVLAALKTVRERSLTAAPDKLAWGPVAFELFTSQTSHRTWFQSYLRTTTGNDVLPVQHRYRLLAMDDADLFARLAARLAGRRHVIVEDYSGRPYRHGRADSATFWLTASPRDLLGEPNPYLVMHHDDDWHVLSSPSPAAARNPTLVARELLRWHLHDAGALVVHASAARCGAGGRMFSGDAGSGKTTLALASAQVGGQFISGDRTALVGVDGGDGANGGLAVAGIALAARVRRGTLSGLDLERRLGGWRPLRDLPGKVLLSQTDLESLGNIGTTAAAPLTAAVFTQRADTDTPRLERVTGAEARRLLQPQVLSYDNRWPRGWLLAGLGYADPPAEPTRREAVFGRLSSLPLLRLTWDPNRGDVAAALDLIAAATDGPAGLTDLAD